MSEESSTDVIVRELVDARCPTGTKGLLGKLVVPKGRDLKSVQDFSIELHCRDCTKDFRKILGIDSILRVVHRYSILGHFEVTQIHFRATNDVKTVSIDTQVEIIALAQSFKPPYKS